MYRNYFIFCLIFLPFLSGCLGNNDYQPIFSTCGIIEESASTSIKIRTDKNQLLSVLNIGAFGLLPQTGRRLLVRYTTDADTSLLNYPITVNSSYSTYIPTMKILSIADTTKIDSIGKNPVAVTEAWLGGGYLNMVTVIGYFPDPIPRLNYRMVKDPSKVDVLYLTVHANDYIGTYFSGKAELLLSVNIDSLLTDNQQELFVSIGGYNESVISMDSTRWLGTYFRAKKYEPVLLEKSKK